MRFWPLAGARGAWGLVLLAVLALHPRGARAQLQFSEVMYGPGGNDALWEWVEIRNTSAGAIDLDGWVFDDDDDPTINALVGANIRAANGNTLVPAGGVAVLYPGSDLDFMPERFRSAWGSAVNLIPVNGFTSLTATDSLGLWPSYAAYAADTIPAAATSPRRTFGSAAAVLDYSSGFPAARNQRSIAWNGVGSPSAGANWVESEAQVLGAVVSVETTIESAPINNPADLGNPGSKPGGSAAAGLLITEIMFAPATPLAPSGWTSTDFEWVEIFNNTGSSIDFATQPHVLDDFVGELSGPNIQAGSLEAGQVGILFNAAKLTVDQLATMWGLGQNYIPVTAWPQLNNSGLETVALWDDYDVYLAEDIDLDDHRAHEEALAAVSYGTTTASGWPAVTSGRSIYLNNLAADPNAGANWTKSGTTADLLGSYHAAQLSELAVDHPGGDVGSPGVAPGGAAAILLGDYNGNGVVDAADYTVWRNRLGGTSLLNDATPDTVDLADYNYWKSHFGATLSGSGSVAAVPEPASGVLCFALVMVLGGLRPTREMRRGRRC